MSFSKGPKDQIAMMALKEAADDADSMDSDNDMAEICQCPKCGYKGPEGKFLLPSKSKPDESGDTPDASEEHEDY